jgi:hypothetical protein
MVMLRADARVAWQIVAGEAILLDLDSGRVIGLNETGTFLWSRLQSQDEHDLLDALAQEFEVDRETARLDLSRFVALLKEHGFVRDLP